MGDSAEQPFYLAVKSNVNLFVLYSHSDTHAMLLFWLLQIPLVCKNVDVRIISNAAISGRRIVKEVSLAVGTKLEAEIE
jgi:hypothetical protein